MILPIYPTHSNIYTQRERAKAATAPRAQKALEIVRDEAPLNAGDGLLLAVVVVAPPMKPVIVVPASALELEPALAPTPAAPDGVAMGETLAVEEMMRVRLEGVLTLDAPLELNPAETPELEVESDPEPVPDPVETVNSFEPAPALAPEPDPETPVSTVPLAPPVAVPVTVTTEKTVEVLVSVPTTTVVVATGTDEV
jgi:hypothetical protein